MLDPGLLTLIGLVLGGSALLLTLLSTNAAMAFLIVSMLLSPEINLGPVMPDRAVVLRLDDFLLAVVFLTWLAKLAINKQLGFLRTTPLNVPLGLFLVSCLVSTGWGVVNGSVKNPAASFFYFLKYFEYFFLFFMVANVVRERRQAVFFLKMLLATAVVVSLCAYAQLVTQGTGFRLTAPFEGSHAEPNTLAGYLVLMISLAAGLALYVRSAPRRLVLLGVCALMVVPLVFTYSRGGYMAFLVMYLVLCLRSTRYRALLWSLLVLGALAAPIVLPAQVLERIAWTFDPRAAILKVAGVGLEESAAVRVLAWRFIVNKWKEHPMLGFGVTGIGLVDSQYPLVIGEVGLIGFALFVWIRWRLLVTTVRTLKTMTEPLAKGLSLGFLAGFVGLLVHALAGNIFIIVRIMEPFWFLAAMVTVLPQLAPSSQPLSVITRGTLGLARPPVRV